MSPNTPSTATIQASTDAGRPFDADQPPRSPQEYWPLTSAPGRLQSNSKPSIPRTWVFVQHRQPTGLRPFSRIADTYLPAPPPRMTRSRIAYGMAAPESVCKSSTAVGLESTMSVQTRWACRCAPVPTGEPGNARLGSNASWDSTRAH